MNFIFHKYIDIDLYLQIILYYNFFHHLFFQIYLFVLNSLIYIFRLSKCVYDFKDVSSIVSGPFTNKSAILYLTALIIFLIEQD
jgi:hypothetical protein